MDGIDPQRLQDAIDVINEAAALPVSHPDQRALQRATSSLFKTVRDQRKKDRIAKIRANDAAVLAATATAAPGRIDDETAGIPLASTTVGDSAGELMQPHACYVCKTYYTRIDWFYHQLCPDCAALHHAKRTARSDLAGKRALLTGGRAKIGMYIALRLLRDGAHTTITTRFPKDAARRFASLEDSADWLDRLKIVGLDLRDPGQVVALAEDVAAAGPLDILINNAAQTVRRTPGAYAPLAEAEHAALSGPEAVPELLSFGETHAALPSHLGDTFADPTRLTPAAISARAMAARQADIATVGANGTLIDAGGLVPDELHINSWTEVVGGIDPVELLEVQLCNNVAPFVLVNALRPALAAAARAARSQRAYVVNVSAMEGVFTRGYKGPGHPHTNMAKAALNMLTRTSSEELFLTQKILMTAVDTGWITDERPHFTKLRMAEEENFHAPLDLVDGAARVYDPIVRGEAGEDLYGVFLKDYVKGRW